MEKKTICTSGAVARYFWIGMLFSGVALCLTYWVGTRYALHGIETGLRCIFLASLFAVACLRRSQMIWIFFAMTAGIELGLDMPSIAAQTHVVSDIFLRLIKTIVAPLVLATLISGIIEQKGSGDVGRLPLKSLVYFEVVTAFALIVGLAAINWTQAGKNASQIASTHRRGDVSQTITAVSGSAAQPLPWKQPCSSHLP